MGKVFYSLDGRPVKEINLSELFKKFAESIKNKEPVGTGNQESKLTEHHNNILHQKERE